MTKLIVAASTAIALLGIATIGLVASEGAALAKPPTGFVYEITGYYYSVEEPEWSTRGVPCWRPWEMGVARRSRVEQRLAARVRARVASPLRHSGGSRNPAQKDARARWDLPRLPLRRWTPAGVYPRARPEGRGDEEARHGRAILTPPHRPGIN